MERIEISCTGCEKINMMKRSTIFIHLIFIVLTTRGQSTYYDHNKAQIESLKNGLDTSCKDYGTLGHISKKERRWDKKIILFLNDVYNKDLSLQEIKRRYAKISPNQITFDFNEMVDLGGFKRYESRIYSEGNLHINLLLILVDDTILYKKIYFMTETRTNCIDQMGVMSEYDVKYLEEYCLKLIDFPILVKDWIYGISTDKTIYKNLISFKAKGYKGFDIDTSKRLDDLIFFQTYHYGSKGPIVWIKDLYKQNKVDSLTEFLHSPNYVVALDAMEALLALNRLKNVALAGEVLKKMEQIKNADTVIWWASSDVIYHRTYKELNLSESEILEKYRKIQ